MGKTDETRKALTRNLIGAHSGKKPVWETERAHTRTSEGDMHEFCFVFNNVILIIRKLKADEAWYAGRGYNVLLICKSDFADQLRCDSCHICMLR